MDEINVFGHCEAKCEHEVRCLILDNIDIGDIKRTGVYPLRTSVTDTLKSGTITAPLTGVIMLVDEDTSDNTKINQVIINKDYHYCRTLTTTGETTTASEWVIKQVVSLTISSTTPTVVNGGIWLKPSS